MWFSSIRLCYPGVNLRALHVTATAPIGNRVRFIGGLAHKNETYSKDLDENPGLVYIADSCDLCSHRWAFLFAVLFPTGTGSDSETRFVYDAIGHRQLHTG